jgi:hypothetical protein
MDTISGGLMPYNGSVKLTIESNKVGFVVTPNGRLLKTVAGVINTTYTGKEGNILYLVDKTSNSVNLTLSGLKGSIICTGDNPLYLSGNSALTSIVANGSKTIDGGSCSLTAKSIGDMLYAANLFDLHGIHFDFRGAANALESEVIASLLAVHDLAYSTVYTKLVTTNGGTILIDTV